MAEVSSRFWIWYLFQILKLKFGRNEKINSEDDFLYTLTQNVLLIWPKSKASLVKALSPCNLWQCSHNFSEQSMKCLLLWFQLFQKSQSSRCPSCSLARAAAVLCLHCCQKSSSFLEWYIEWYHLMIFWMIFLNDIYQDIIALLPKVV